MKTSWKALLEFSGAANAYLARVPTDTKLKYAITRVGQQIRKCQEKISQQIADIEIDTCVVDDNGVITRDGAGNLQFTREGLKTRNQKQHELVTREDLEIEPHIVAAPADLTPFELEVFGGLVIKSEAKGAS